MATSAAAAADEVMSRTELGRQVEVAMLDMGRLVFAYQWSRAKFGVEALNRNAYNKDVRSAVWLAARVDDALRGLEQA